jgi:hypothetical protein
MAQKRSDPGAGGAKVQNSSSSLTASPQDKHPASTAQAQRLTLALAAPALARFEERGSPTVGESKPGCAPSSREDIEAYGALPCDAAFEAWVDRARALLP